MFSPFDGKKVLYHVRYWESMLDGKIPPPVLVTLDPIHRCNLNCRWCNSNGTIEKDGAAFSEETIQALPSVLAEWGVKAVCIAGGGEPLMHPRLGALIRGLRDSAIEVGIVTNGLLLHKHMDTLDLCRWIGVSVDAGRATDYSEQKGVNGFPVVINNMRQVRAAFPSLELTYKFLIHPGTMHGLYRGALTAREVGCNYFHARPAGLAWMDIPRTPQRSLFTPEDVRVAVHMLQACDELTTATFKVVNTPDKFKAIDWSIQHDFTHCRAVGMTCVIQANGAVGLCCDRRGDERLELCRWEHPKQILEAWGSERHKQLMAAVNLQHCPRCTYAPHNRLLEDFADGDVCCKWFI